VPDGSPCPAGAASTLPFSQTPGVFGTITPSSNAPDARGIATSIGPRGRRRHRFFFDAFSPSSSGTRSGWYSAKDTRTVSAETPAGTRTDMPMDAGNHCRCFGCGPSSDASSSFASDPAASSTSLSGSPGSRSRLGREKPRQVPAGRGNRSRSSPDSGSKGPIRSASSAPRRWSRTSSAVPAVGAAQAGVRAAGLEDRGLTGAENVPGAAPPDARG